MSLEYETDELGELGPIEARQTEIDTAWDEDSASEIAAFTALQSGGGEATYDQVKKDHLDSGHSTPTDQANSIIKSQRAEVSVSAVAPIIKDPEIADDIKQLVVADIKQQYENPFVDTVQEVLLNMNDASEAQADNENDAQVAAANYEPFSQQIGYRHQIKDIAGQMARAGFKMEAGAALDFAATFFSVNDMESYTAMMDDLKLDYDARKTVVPGELMNDIANYVKDKSPKEQYEIALVMQDLLQKNAGILGTNEIQAATMFSDIFNDQIGGDPDSFNWSRWFLNAGPAFDAVSVYSLGIPTTIKNAIAAPFRLGKLSRLSKTAAANPKAAADIAEEAVLSGKTAEMVGETADDLIVKTGLPKADYMDEITVPPVMTDKVTSAAVLREADIVDKVVTAQRGQGAIKQAATQLEDTARGHKHWVTESKITGQPGKPWEIKATIGKTDGYGFASKTEAKEILKDVYGGQGKIVSRTSRVGAVEEVLEKGKALPAAKQRVLAELESAKTVKLSRGERKSLKKELKSLEHEIAKRTVNYEDLPKGTNRKIQDAFDATVANTRSNEPLQREVDEIRALLDASTFGERAERNISRLLQDQFGELDADVKKRLDALMETKVIQEGKAEEEAIEYFIEVNQKSDIKFLDDDVAISVGGDKNSWLLDADSKLHPRLAQMGNAVFDKWKYLEKEMLRLLDPIAKLNNKDQVAVSKLLIEGDKYEKVFSSRQMRELGFGDAAQEAYRDYRKAMDIAFTLENRVFKKTLVMDDMQHIKTGGYEGFGKPLSRSQAEEVTHAYDPVSKVVARVDANEVYEGGAQIARLRRAEVKDGQGSQFILLRDSGVNPLPEQVLTKRKGYVPKTNKSDYFITRTDKVVIDGKPRDRTLTIGVAGNLTEVSKSIKNLKGSETVEGVTYEMKHDRGLTSVQDYAESMHDIYSATGGLFYSKRGEQLTNSIGQSSEIKDPLQAAVNAISRVTRDVSLRPYLDDMKARFIATYDDISMTKGRFPAEARFISKQGQLADPKVLQAKTMWQHIKMLEGSANNEFTKRSSIIVADYIERNLPGEIGQSASNLIRGGGDTDPVSWIRARNFELNLQTNPLAQLVVQPMQTANMLGIAPSTFVADFRRGRMVSKLASKRADVTMSNQELTQTAKTLDMTVDELRADVRSFRRSGGNAAITSHETARDAQSSVSASLSANPARRLGNSALDLYRKPVSWLGRGFERGEEINIGVHWQVAKRRWMKSNPDKSPYTSETEFAIQGEARSLSLSMTQPGDFSYQRGILAIPTQYLPVQHKQLLLMTTSKAVTTPEKIRIAAAQLALWGPQGLGLGNVIWWAASQREIDMSEGLANFLNDGVVEWTINNVLSFVLGEETELDLGGRFAAASGLTDNVVTMVAEMLMKGETADLWKIIAGPTAGNYNRFANAADTISTMYNSELPTYEKITQSVDALLSVASSWNNATKAKFYANGGWWTDAQGDKLFTPTDLELAAKATLGINPNRLDEYYNVKNKKRQRDEDLKETAEMYYTQVNRLTVDYLNKGEFGSEILAAYKAEIAVRNAMVSMHAEDADEIMQMVQRKVKRNIETNGFDELTSSMTKMMMQNGKSRDAREIINGAVSADHLSPDDVETYRSFLGELMGEDQ